MRDPEAWYEWEIVPEYEFEVEQRGDFDENVAGFVLERTPSFGIFDDAWSLAKSIEAG